MTDTETQKRVNIVDMIEYLKNDPFLLEKFLADIKSCIDVKRKRIITAEKIIEIARLPYSERLVATKEIKNQELLEYFLRHNRVFEPDREKLYAGQHLKETFREVYGNNPLFKRIDGFFNQERATFMQAIDHAEKMRKAYLGKLVENKNLHSKILACLCKVPFGSRDLAYEVIFDLAHFYFGSGVYGSGVCVGSLRERNSSLIIKQQDHPTLQGVSYK